MFTNKHSVQLCAEFISAIRATGQNHWLTVGQPARLYIAKVSDRSCANCVPIHEPQQADIYGTDSAKAVLNSATSTDQPIYYRRVIEMASQRRAEDT
jgi:hypothetical protein